MKRIEQTRAIIENYYDAFCKKDWERFFSCVDEHVVHDRADGLREKGKAAFRAFMEHARACYDERIENLEIAIEPPGDEAEVECDVVGTYLKQDGDRPPAHGQTYHLSVGAYFTVKGGKITRISAFHDEKDWLYQLRK